MDERYRISGDTDDVDRVQVHRWLSEQAYWAKGRTREHQDRAIDGSRSWSVLDRETGAQVAYARVVTDGATFAWLGDVFVEESVRGKGVGQALIAAVLADLDGLGLKRILLATADAHTLYARFGFVPLDQPERMMVLYPPS